MNIDFDVNAHKFLVDAPFWKTTIAFGDEHAFIVNSDLNANQLKSLEQIAASSSIFGNNITGSVIIFDATAVGFIAHKDMPIPSEDSLTRAFEFGFIQGMKQSDLHCVYWGKSAADGRSIRHTSLSNLFEVDTSGPTKPFTRLPGRRNTAKLIPSANKGFHAFKINAKFTDHPQFVVDRFHYFRFQGDILPRKFLLRSVSCELTFVTIFSLFDKKASKFDSISATHWRVKWDHTLTYQERINSSGVSEFLPTVSGPDRDRLPSGGSPSDVNQVARDVIAMAQAGSPLVTPEVLKSRMNAGAGVTVTNEDRNDDFNPSFITAAH